MHAHGGGGVTNDLMHLKTPIHFEIFHNTSLEDVDFSKTPDLVGEVRALTLDISPCEENVVVRYTGKFDVPKSGKYKILSTTSQIRSRGSISVDGKKLYDFARMPVFSIVELEQGTHEYTLTCARAHTDEEEIKFVVEPYHLLVDENQLAKRMWCCSY